MKPITKYWILVFVEIFIYALFINPLIKDKFSGLMWVAINAIILVLIIYTSLKLSR